MKLVASRRAHRLLLFAAPTALLIALAWVLPVFAGNQNPPLLDASRRPVDLSAIDHRTPSLDSPDLDGSWSQFEPFPGGPLPPARYSHAAIYDPVRDRIVVFGGYDGSSFYNDAWQLLLSGTPTWTQLAPTGTPPSGRYGHTAIYDPARDRMLVMGGFGGSFYNDTWALSLSGSPAWTPLAATGTPPPIRYFHTAIYDPVRDRMVVFGGRSGPLYNDVWALSLSGIPTWTQLAPTGTSPLGRDSHTAIYDPLRDQMVVFGGRRASFLLDDIWTLSLAGTPAWSQMNPTGGPTYQSYGHTAIYDPARDRMVTFGGYYDGTSPLDDSWALSLAGDPSWTRLAPGGPSVPPRDFHAAIYDSVRDRMVVFGGTVGIGTPVNDTWALDWTPTPNPVLFSTINASVDERGVVLHWKLVADEPISGFEIYRRASGDGERSLNDVLLDPTLRTLRDDNIERGRTYEYFVVAVLPGGDRIQSQRISVETPPLALTLHQNHPNPFNPTTSISFVLSAKLQTRLTIYDAKGRTVRKLLDEGRSPGFNEVSWDGRDDRGEPAASGVYFYELRAGKNALVKKMVLLK